MGSRFLKMALFFCFSILAISCGEVELRRDITITHLSISAADPTLLYAATDSMGAWVHVSGEKIWKLMNHGVKTQRTTFLTHSPFDSHLLYMGTWGGGVYRSDDRGKSWRAMNEGLKNSTVIKLIFDPSDPRMVYLLTMHGGVFQSHSQGISWIPFSQGLNQPDKNRLEDLLLQPSNPPLLYLATQKGLYQRQTTDERWTRVKEFEDTFVSALAYNPSQDVVYVGAGLTGQLFKSEDKGLAWSALGKPLGGIIRPLLVDSTTAILYAAIYGKGVLRSTDQGISWEVLNQGLPTGDLKALIMDPQNTHTLYAGLWGGGVFKSTQQGKRWGSLNQGFPEHSSIDFTFLSKDPVETSKEVRVPEVFAKCNVCHGWADPLLNLRRDSWYVVGTPRDWEFTVKRMNAHYERTTGESLKDALSAEEESTVIKFLNRYYGKA